MNYLALYYPPYIQVFYFYFIKSSKKCEKYNETF